MNTLTRLLLVLSVLASTLALSGCFIRSEPGYYGNGYGRGGNPHGGPPGHMGGRGRGR